MQIHGSSILLLCYSYLADSNAFSFRHINATASALRTEYLPSPYGVDVDHPRFSWQLTPATASMRGVTQAAYHLQVSADGFQTVSWDSGRVNASESTLVPYNGTELISDGEYAWRVMAWLSDGSSTSFATSRFHTGLLHPGDWQAQWITGGDSTRLLRREFYLDVSVRGHATLFMAALGYGEVFLNGHAVSSEKLGPWSDFGKRVLYRSYDVAGLLRVGANVVGVSLGNGWFSCGPPPGTSQPSCFDSPPQLLLQLHVDQNVVLISDSRWRAAASPVRSDSLYNGEVYDGRIRAAVTGWTEAAYDDGSWSPVANATSSPAANAVLAAALFEPTRYLDVLHPAAVTLPAPGVQVFDFGQNLAGIVRLTGLRCDRGTNVTLRHAELLQHPPYGPADGSIYVANLRGAKATDVYTCSGDPSGEEYEPTFTQHGFRYAEVSGLASPLAADAVSAIEMHTAIERRSSLAFSDPMLNAILHATVWGQKSNVMSGVPTDCPNRDERKGWTGDSAMTAEEASYNFGMAAVYSRWLEQFVDVQSASGATNDFVPPLGWYGPGSPNWQSAYPILLHVLYMHHGDTSVLARHHGSLCRYYDNLEALYNETGVAHFHEGNMYGDWVVPPPAPMGNKSLIASYALLHDLKLGEAIFSGSAAVGAATRARRCAKLFEVVAGDFHRSFFDATRGFYGTGLQTEQALPLVLDIVPSSLRPALVAFLVDDIVNVHRLHTTSGIIGIKATLEVLAVEGRTDVALAMLQQDTCATPGLEPRQLLNTRAHPVVCTNLELTSGVRRGQTQVTATCSRVGRRATSRPPHCGSSGTRTSPGRR